MRYVVFTLVILVCSANAQTPSEVPVEVYQLQSGETLILKGRTPETPAVEDKEELNKLFYQQHLFNIGFTGGVMFMKDKSYKRVIRPEDNITNSQNVSPVLHLEGGLRPPWAVVNRMYLGGDFNMTGGDSGDSHKISGQARMLYRGFTSHSFFAEYDALILSRNNGTALSVGVFQGKTQIDPRDENNAELPRRNLSDTGLQFRWRTTVSDNDNYGGSMYVLAKVNRDGVWTFLYGYNAQFGTRFRVRKIREK